MWIWQTPDWPAFDFAPSGLTAALLRMAALTCLLGGGRRTRYALARPPAGAESLGTPQT